MWTEGLCGALYGAIVFVNFELMQRGGRLICESCSSSINEGCGDVKSPKYFVTGEKDVNMYVEIVMKVQKFMVRYEAVVAAEDEHDAGNVSDCYTQTRWCTISSHS